MRRLLIAVPVAGLLLVLAAGPAVAHAGLVPGELQPGVPTEAQVVLAHGCGPQGTVPAGDEDAAPTRTVTLEVPPTLRLTPRDVEGWGLATTSDDQGEVQRARWETEDAGGAPGTIFLDVEVEVTADLDDGAELWLPVVQECVDGSTMAWTATGMHGEEDDGGAEALPAMLLRVDAAALTSDEPATWAVVAVVLAAALVGGGVAVGLTLRR